MVALVWKRGLLRVRLVDLLDLCQGGRNDIGSFWADLEMTEEKFKIHACNR